MGRLIAPKHKISDAQRVREEEGVHYLKQMGSQLLGHVVQGSYPARLSPGVAQTCKGTKELVRPGQGARKGPRSPSLPAERPRSPARGIVPELFFYFFLFFFFFSGNPAKGTPTGALSPDSRRPSARPRGYVSSQRYPSPAMSRRTPTCRDKEPGTLGRGRPRAPGRLPARPQPHWAVCVCVWSGI